MSRPRTFKRLALRGLTLGPVARALKALRRGRVSVMMLHRFTDGDPAIAGHMVSDLIGLLEAIRRWRLPVLGVADLARAADSRTALPDGAVIFTVDDGYEDFVRLAMPAFAAFDCPVTVFLTTGFIDGACWLWWDQVAYAFAASPREGFEASLGTHRVAFAWSTPAERAGATADFVRRLKQVDDGIRRTAVARLGEVLDVEVPDRAPDRFRPMTWDDVRRTATKGATFGPHTVSHPILSRSNDAQARQEIHRSWARVREASGAPVPVFCYPNGDPSSFGARERALVREAGLRLALTAVPAYVTTEHLAPARPDAAYAVPRFACPSDALGLGEIVLGLERLRRRRTDSPQT